MRAYLQLKSEYDEAVAAAATQAGINIQGEIRYSIVRPSGPS